MSSRAVEGGGGGRGERGYEVEGPKGSERGRRGEKKMARLRQSLHTPLTPADPLPVCALPPTVTRVCVDQAGVLRLLMRVTLVGLEAH